MKLSQAQLELEIKLVWESVNRGDIVKAERILDSVLASNPESAEANFTRGMMFARALKPAEALRYLEIALVASPENADVLAWASLTSLHLFIGDKAEQFARRLLAVQPRNDRGHFLLSSSLTLQSRFEEAVTSIDRALALRPTEPDFIVAKAQLLGRLGWSSQAIEWYRKALKVRPAPDLKMDLAAMLIDEGQPEAALVELEQVVNWVSPEAIPHELFAQAYAETQQFDKAARYWSSAKELATDQVNLMLKRVTAEIYSGRLNVAEDLIGEALEDFPGAAQFYQLLTTIRKITPADTALVERMEQLRKQSSEDPEAERDLSYALGKSFHDLGQYGEAMRCYDDANRIGFNHSSICKRFDPIAWSAYTDLQMSFFNEEKIKQLMRDGIDSTTPLFIVGMLRSGTTLTEQILSRHSKIKAGGEKTFWPDHRDEILDPKTRSFDAFRGKQLARSYLRMLTEQANDVRYVTEKNPANIILAGLIHCVYPSAKLVHIKRHPIDNLLSIWMTPMRTGLPFVYHRDHLVAAYKDYLRLAKHLAKVLPEDRFQTFSYEEITTHPEPTVTGLLNYLNLEPEEDCFHPERSARTVRTPSYFQVRQPINTNSQAKWKLYEPWLGSFEELLSKE